MIFSPDSPVVPGVRRSHNGLGAQITVQAAGRKRDIATIADLTENGDQLLLIPTAARDEELGTEGSTRATVVASAPSGNVPP